jgi:hypothetical protein
MMKRITVILLTFVILLSVMTTPAHATTLSSWYEITVSSRNLDTDWSSQEDLMVKNGDVIEFRLTYTRSCAIRNVGLAIVMPKELQPITGLAVVDSRRLEWTTVIRTELRFSVVVVCDESELIHISNELLEIVELDGRLAVILGVEIEQILSPEPLELIEDELLAEESLLDELPPEEELLETESDDLSENQEEVAEELSIEEAAL